MRERELPATEWPRLKGIGCPLEPVLETLDPRFVKIGVVENDEGAIVGSWAALLLVHGEGAWIAEPHRGRIVVARRLWRVMKQIVTGWGAQSLVTGSDTVLVTDLLRGHGQALPPQYVLPLVKGVH